MFDIFLRGANGAEPPMKINVLMDSKTTEQIFMKFKTYILGVRPVVTQYV